jgi:AAA-like domain/PEGA domain
MAANARNSIERSTIDNFYVVGGTLARDAPSYVEREADKRLLTALHQGEICYVLTSRQMGKSSLMVRTAVKLREEGISVAVLDLTSLGQNLSAEQWYNGLLDRTGQQLSLEDEIEDAWTESTQLGPFQRWVQVMQNVVLPSCRRGLVVFIDEIDTVRSLPFKTDEFFAGIRELYNRRTEEPELGRLTFCLLGVATPSDLIRDTRTTPFNVGRRIELTDFGEDEAAPLVLGMSHDSNLGERLVSRILYWTGGHPYLTQRLCQAVAEDTKFDSPKCVDEMCTRLFLSSRARERDDNLLFVRDRILRSEGDIAGLLSLYGKVRAGKKIRYDEANPLIGVLRLSGIAAIEEGYLKVRNRIYQKVFDEEWIISNLPGAEIRRQRAAYKKGFRRAALAAAPLMLLAGGYAYYVYSVNIAPPNFSKHAAVPVFWLSSRMTAQPKAVGSLRLQVGQENVTVFINDLQFGSTSKDGELVVPALPVGAYKIRLVKSGFQTVTTPDVPIFTDKEYPLKVTLQPIVMFGTVKIVNAPADTTVHLDGAYIGDTDQAGALSIPSSPGEHKLELTKDGFLSGTQTLQVKTDNVAVVSGKLNPDPQIREWADLANSTDPQAFLAFRSKYPNGRFAAEAYRKAAQLKWNTVKDSHNAEELEAYTQLFRDSPYAAEAHKRSEESANEEQDYRLVSSSENEKELEKFLTDHREGPHASQVNQQLTNLQDRKAIIEVIRQYQDAFDQKDMTAILRIWPTCPEVKQKNLNVIFHDGANETLKLEAKGQPEVAGDSARVLCDKTRISSGATNKSTVEVMLKKKEAGSWFIDGGTF